MNKFRNKIKTLKITCELCNSLSSIAKYKYINYTNRIRKIKKILSNIEELNDKKYTDNISNNNNIGCIIIIHNFNMLHNIYKILESYKFIIIICDENTFKNIENKFNSDTNIVQIYKYSNKKIREFNTNKYEGSLLNGIFENLKNDQKQIFDIYSQNKYEGRYNNLNDKQNTDNNLKYTHIHYLYVAILMNEIISIICLKESNNFEEAEERLKEQIIKEKRNYKNFQSKQHLFNLSKFHI